MKCLTHNLEVNYPCSPACPLFGDCVVAFQNEQKKWVQTNADRIRAMDDETLAEFLYRYFWGRLANLPNREERLLEWLQQPAEEGSDRDG